MNALTASVIVALIGAIAFVVVAVITARARIGLLPAIVGRDSPNANSSNPSDVTTHVAIDVFHWDQWEAFFGSQLSDRAEIALYSRFWIAIAVVLIFIGLWAQWRLRRRSM
jgi:hypothetical protein